MTTMEQALKYYPWQNKLREMSAIGLYNSFEYSAKKLEIPEEDMKHAENLWRIWRQT
jgi:hypothetical protein